MRTLRFMGQTVIHGALKHLDFDTHAYTACDLLVYWKDALDEIKTADPHRWAWLTRRNTLAECVNGPIDCMTCLVNDARA